MSGRTWGADGPVAAMATPDSNADDREGARVEIREEEKAVVSMAAAAGHQRFGESPG